MQRFNEHLADPLPAELEGVSLLLQGRVVGLPDVSPERTRFRFQVGTAGEHGSAQQRVAGAKLQLSCYRCPWRIEPGQDWQFSLRLKRPHSYASWGAFDYEKYLFRHRLIATGYVRVKETNALLSQRLSGVDQWRWQLSQQLSQALPDATPGRAMMGALMLGDRSQMSANQKLVMQQTGVSHLMAISGLHVGLVFVLAVWLCNRLLSPLARLYQFIPRQILVLFPAWLCAAGYAALAGFAVSTQRALVMASVFVLAKILARSVSLLRVLGISAAIILLYDPYSILDVGFWLSCAAVFIIAMVVQSDQTISLLRLQPALWLGMLPATTLFFGQISLVSPLVNLLMVPLFCTVLIPALLLALMLLLSSLSDPASWLLQPLQWALDRVYSVLEWVAQLPLAHAYPPLFQLEDVLVSLTLILSYLVVPQLHRALRGLLWLCLLVMLTTGPAKPSQGQADITLLDVGQGLSMVIETANATILYDTGPAYGSGFSAAKAVVLPYLRGHNTRRLQSLVISHADNDHIGGLKDVLNSVEVGRRFSSTPDKVEGGIPCVRGQSWQVDGVSIDVLSPEAGTPAGSNNHSCVLRVSVAGIRVLITGDIERAVERYLLSSGVDLQADVMLVPHQGSKTSSTVELLDAVRPKLALVAAGYRNHYGHPHPDVLARYKARGIDVKSTIASGSIRLQVRADGWRVQSYRQTFPRFWRPQKKPIGKA